jgi:hypothetical protein
MLTKVKIRLREPMPTRPCEVGLALEDDSVFADFDVDPGDATLYLVRISFDGYGCCRPPDGIGRMSRSESQLLIDMAARHEVDERVVEPILRNYFAQNARVLWDDALRRYDLL